MTDHHHRRWFQLSLKSLFGLTLLVATFFAGYTVATERAEEAIRTERDARRAAEKLAQRADRTAQMQRLFGSGVDEPPGW